MTKASKQSKGGLASNPSMLLHATPVSNAFEKVAPLSKNSVLKTELAAKIAIPSLKVPNLTLKLPTIIPQDDFDSVDREVSTPSSDSAKIYTFHTGLPETEPVIVATAEFVPLYEGGQRSQQGAAISLKENAKIVTAKTAISVLLQEKDVKDAIEANKKTLTAFIETESGLMNRMAVTINQAHGVMDLSTYSLPHNKSGLHIGSFYEILKKGGYSSNNIVNFTQTKLWQQSMVEVKRTLLAHTADLVSQNFTRSKIKNDSDPFVLSDVDNPPEGLKRLWINPYYVALPSIVALTDSTKIKSNMNSLIDFSKNQFVNLIHANPPEKNIRSTNTNSLKKTVTLKTGALNSTKQPLTLSTDVLKPYEDSGRDISILANAVFKEAVYSSYLLKTENINMLAEKFGYTVSKTGDNFQVWDHIVGRFPNSVLDVVKNPTGKGSSLVSISQTDITKGQDTYHVLTFEKNYLENSNSTPGAYYYIDSALNTTDGKTFDTTRLDDLLIKVNRGYATTKTIIDMMGYTINKRNPDIRNSMSESYEKRKLSDEVSLEGMMDKLSIVASTYHKGLRKNTEGLHSLDLKAFLSGGTATENTAIRLAALICKCAVDPSNAYRQSSSRLKNLLFLWMINVVLQQSESYSNSSTIVSIRDMITQELGSVTVLTTQDDIQRARVDGRAIATSVSNSQKVVSQHGKASKDLNDAVNALADMGVDIKSEVDAAVSASSKEMTLMQHTSSSNKLFNVDSNKGLWKVITDLLKDVYDSPDIYQNDVTGYSGMSRTAFVYSYFDLILKIIAAQTPENLLGTYTISTSRPGATSNETGFLTMSDAKEQLNDRFSLVKTFGSFSPRSFVTKLDDAVSYLRAEEDVAINKIALIRKYLADLNMGLMSYRNFLTQSFELYLRSVNAIYTSDDELTQSQKNSLINLSLSDEQLKMARYVMSELRDRIQEGDSSAKLKTTNWFKTFPDGFEDLINMDETDMISYSMLSPYFKSKEFLAKKGGNKKIVSIGIPPKLNRTLHTSTRLSSDNANGLKQGLIRLKVYKLDKLHPDIVYLPKSYLFEMNRFPTRILKNWDYTSFADDVTNILSMPSKLIAPNNEIYIHRNYSDAFPGNFYGNILTQQEKYEIYVNHSISFLVEEYLRWFTDCRFDEARYHHFAPLSKTLKNVEDQYKSYLKMTKKRSVNTSGTGAGQQGGQVYAQYTDPTSGESFNVPVSNPKQSEGDNSKVRSVNEKKTFTIPMDKTVRAFFQNETFFTNPLDYVKRIFYPKKFDRVFNVIVDPDDFYVDVSLTSPSSIKSLVELGVLVRSTESNGTVYKHRDTYTSDVSLDEYFVTMEPYDYVQESEL